MENSRTRAKLVQVISRSQSLDLSTTTVTRYRADGGTASETEHGETELEAQEPST